MNGRIYDPKLGRMLQADPFIQSPTHSQSLNRYSYVLNNPLSYTDPSGYWFKELVGFVVAVVRVVATYGEDPTAWSQLAAAAIALVRSFQSQNASLPSGVTGGAFTNNNLAATSNWLGGSQSGESQHERQDSNGVIEATIGGTSSEQTGDKFTNGAGEVSFAYSTNYRQQNRESVFDTANPYYHYYERSFDVCTLSTACTQEAVWILLKRFPAPGWDEDQEVFSGARTNISFFLIPGGQVTHLVDESNLTVRNITRPGHIFSDGYVNRTVAVRNGKIVIHTVGEGITSPGTFGPFTSAIRASMNILLYRPGFDALDEEIRERMVE